MINVGGKNVNKQLNEIKEVFVSVNQFGAKGDGVTDDSASIQAAINFCSAKGGGVVTFLPTTQGYRIGNPITLSGGIILDGKMSKLVVDSSVTQKDLFTILNKTGRIEIRGFDATVPMSSVIFVHAGAFTGDLVVRDVKADGFFYFIKADNNNTIDNVITENIRAVNCTMGIHLNDVNRFVGNNIYTQLQNLTKFEHHYYFGENVGDTSLTKIRASNGAGSVFQYNANGATQTVPISFVADDVKCHDVARFISVTMDMQRMYLSNVYVDNQTVLSGGALEFIYLDSKNIDFVIDKFYIENPYSLLGLPNTGFQSVKVTFSNGTFGRFQNETSLSNINEFNMFNVTYKNIIYGVGSSTPAASGSLFLFAITAGIKLNVRNVTLNMITAGLTLASTNLHIIRIGSGDGGEYIFENIRLFTDNSAVTNAGGRFFYHPTALTTATVKFINCDSRTMSSFDGASSTITYYYKNNTYQTRTLVT